MKLTAEEIKAALTDIERKMNVRLVMAAETGMRAWGYEVGDSVGHRVVAVFVRTAEDYERLKKPEFHYKLTPNPSLTIDLMDLQMYLRKLAEGVALYFEWEESPVFYRTTPAWEKVKKDTKFCYSEYQVARHYQAMAKKMFNHYIKDKELVTLCSYYEPVRNVLAVRYLWKYHAFAPHDMRPLAAEFAADNPAVIEEVNKLEASRASDQMYVPAPVNKVLYDFIEEQVGILEPLRRAMPNDVQNPRPDLSRVFKDAMNLMWRKPSAERKKKRLKAGK